MQSDHHSRQHSSQPIPAQLRPMPQQFQPQQFQPQQFQPQQFQPQQFQSSYYGVPANQNSSSYYNFTTPSCQQYTNSTQNFPLSTQQYANSTQTFTPSSTNNFPPYSAQSNVNESDIKDDILRNSDETEY